MAAQSDARIVTGTVTWIEHDGDEQEIEVGGRWLRVAGPLLPDLRGQDVTALCREEGLALIVLRIEGRRADGTHRVLWTRTRDVGTRHGPRTADEGEGA